MGALCSFCVCVMLTPQLYLVPKFKKERYYAATRMSNLIGLKDLPVGLVSLGKATKSTQLIADFRDKTRIQDHMNMNVTHSNTTIDCHIWYSIFTEKHSLNEKLGRSFLSACM